MYNTSLLYSPGFTCFPQPIHSLFIYTQGMFTLLILSPLKSMLSSTQQKSMPKTAKERYMKDNHLSLFQICLPVVLFNGTLVLCWMKRLPVDSCLTFHPSHKGVRTVYSTQVWATQEFVQKDDTPCFGLHLPFTALPTIQFALLTAANL